MSGRDAVNKREENVLNSSSSKGIFHFFHEASGNTEVAQFVLLISKNKTIFTSETRKIADKEGRGEKQIYLLLQLFFTAFVGKPKRNHQI